MRSFLLAATAALAFAATMTFESTSAQAVVCATRRLRRPAGRRGGAQTRRRLPLGGGERRKGPPLHLIKHRA